MRWSVGAAPRSHRGPTHGPSSRGRRPPTLPPSPSSAPRLLPPLAPRLSPLTSSRLPPPLASCLLPLASGGAAGIRTELEPIDSTPGGAPAERARGTVGAASERPRDARATESFALVSPLPPPRPRPATHGGPLALAALRVCARRAAMAGGGALAVEAGGGAQPPCRFSLGASVLAFHGPAIYEAKVRAASTAARATRLRSDATTSRRAAAATVALQACTDAAATRRRRCRQCQHRANRPRSLR